MIKTIGLALAAAYALLAVIVNIIASFRIIQNYINTGRVSDNDDEPVTLTKNKQFSFFRRSTGLFALITGLLLDLIIIVALMQLWFVALPVMILILIVVYLRLKKVRKDDFINALKGKQDEDSEWE